MDNSNNEELEEICRHNVESNMLNDIDINKTELNAYVALMPFFKEILCIYQGNCNLENLKLVEAYFDKQVGLMKNKINDNRKCPSNLGHNYISSHIIRIWNITISAPTLFVPIK